LRFAITCPFHADRAWRELRGTCACGHPRALHHHPTECGCPFDGHPCHAPAGRAGGQSSCAGAGFDNDHWADAVDLDRALRDQHTRQGAAQAKLCDPVYLHRSLRPLDQVDLSTPEDHGQLLLLDGFGNQCQGVYGL
jgi:hypothetical protein